VIKNRAVINLNWLIIVSILGFLLLPTQLFARTAAEIEASLINTAGMQRMLSQRITKDYLYLGAEIRMGKSLRQMKGSVSLLLNNHGVLKKSVKDGKAQGLLGQLDPMVKEFKQLSTGQYTVRNAAKMLKLGDEILITSHELVEHMESVATQKTSRLVNVSGRQRMLSQRISKLYIAYQSGFQDSSVVGELNKSLELYETSHKELADSTSNTEKISRELARVQNLWKTVRPFFKEIEKGGYAVTVFVTTDAIMRQMNNVTRLYVRLSSKKKEKK